MGLWDRIIIKAKDIDAWRKLHMAFAEWVDAWRIIPRLLVVSYAIMTWHVVKWYMDLKPYVIEGCDVDKFGTSCLANAPTTEHMALVTAVLAVAAAVFGLYTGSGKKWDRFVHWNNPNTYKQEDDKQNKNDGE